MKRQKINCPCFCFKINLNIYMKELEEPGICPLLDNNFPGRIYLCSYLAILRSTDGFPIPEGGLGCQILLILINFSS
jgi:hypothetical protein